jgi:hypothetical protein
MLMIVNAYKGLKHTLSYASGKSPCHPLAGGCRHAGGYAMKQERTTKRRYRITYRRKGWGSVEFVKVYEHETHGLESALKWFIEENTLSKEDIIKLEQLDN